MTVGWPDPFWQNGLAMPDVNPPARPLSPHLQVYRLALTTVLSGLHRVTGLLLTLASLLLAVWLVAIALGGDVYSGVARALGSWPVRILLAGTLAIFWYHLFNGLRHLAWDAGFGFELRAARRSGALVVAATALASAGTLLLTPAGRWLAGMP